MGTIIETITVTRPMKVIAFTCCFVTTLLMVAACASSEWLMSEGWREGLFQQCVNEGAPMPLPFDSRPFPGCYRAHPSKFVRATAALMVIAVFTDFFGTLLTGLGLRSTDPNKKYKYYRIAIYSLILCCVALLISLILYPVGFSKEMADDGDAQLYNGKTVPKIEGSIDFDGDGLFDWEDDDDDDDGIPDAEDRDDDNDGIPDRKDPDDDNDGVLDVDEKVYKVDDDDQDNDGVDDSIDTDDDNDGIPDAEDKDDDNDGVEDSVDKDDDNDGIPDTEENAPKDDDDLDNDGIDDSVDNDDDNDGIADSEDTDDDNDGIPDKEDKDDDNDGVPDAKENDADDEYEDYPVDPESNRRVWSFGFGYGASWSCFLLIFMSVVLLVCDRESEEIFYKEKQVEDEEEGLED